MGKSTKKYGHFNGYIKLPEGTRKNEQVCNENLLMGSTKQVKQTCSIENKNESWAWVQIGINSGNRFMLAGSLLEILEMCLFSGKCGLEQNGFSNICWLLHCLSTQFEYGINICFFCSWDCVKFRCLHQNDTGWWFGTFSIFHNIWDNPSHWFSYFSRWWLQHQPDMFQKLERRGWKTFDYLLSTRFESWKLSANKNLKYYVCTPRIVEMSRHLWLIHFFWIVKPLILGYVPLFFLDIPIICIRTIMNM